jgi:hypothetical protein
MPRARLENVIEYLRGTENRYLIGGQGEDAHSFAPDSAEWFVWLDELSSFHFTGKHGHFTARQEHKPGGEGFWYAYLKAHGRLHKRYLGTTNKLTLSCLEQTAERLHEEAVCNLPEDEVLINRSRKPRPSTQALIVGPLTFQWEDGILTVKTPTERHFLNRLQTAELLGYLYDQRGALLNKLK